MIVPNLSVWDSKCNRIPFLLRIRLREVTGHQQYTPEIIFRLMQALICQFVGNRLCNRSSVQQGFKFSLCVEFPALYKVPDNTVSADVLPVVFRLGSLFSQQCRDIVYHIPRAVYLFISRDISTIPFFENIPLFFQIRRLQQLIGLLLCETETAAKLIIQHRI